MGITVIVNERSKDITHQSAKTTGIHIKLIIIITIIIKHDRLSIV